LGLGSGDKAIGEGFRHKEFGVHGLGFMSQNSELRV